MPLCGFGKVSHTIATLRKASTEARHNTAVLSHSRRIITPSSYFTIVTSMIAIRGVTKFEGGNRSALTPSPRVLPLSPPSQKASVPFLAPRYAERWEIRGLNYCV
ncbi:uncharacterized protein B0T23DRAFT_381817 [Neurospora hispaniola]|uniref:Uncharacterized protein n=1 Tax=Neurospora hispaniola TaxID=588809 RepID=A0AAJ0MQ99_9PEZI|nr:hypothetical protein B0T23DRAFT_381817 [Neurospora hispaniola]